MTTLTLDSKTLIDALLGKDTTPEVIDAIVARLDKIVLPWRRNDHVPPQFERQTATGKLVGIVDSWLGGYGSPNKPEHHGWGYKACGPDGYGQGTSGIIKVEPVDRAPIDDAVICSRTTAMIKVDQFLTKYYPDLVLLNEEGTL
jgi:hypothetical protein